MKIGELAKKIGITTETIRFYETKNLLSKPEREINGYRNYTEEHYNALCFIQKTKKLGFSLKEITEFLELYSLQKGRSCGDLEKILKIKKQEINQKISDLQVIYKSLNSLHKLFSNKCLPETKCDIMKFL